MNKPAPKEPSMDEILSSIRQIIADDDAGGAPKRASGLGAAPLVQPSPPLRPALSPVSGARPAPLNSVASRPTPVTPPETEPENEPEPLALSPMQIMGDDQTDDQADFGAMMQMAEASPPEGALEGSGFSAADLVDPDDIAFDVEAEVGEEDDPMAMFSVEPEPEPEPVPVRAPRPMPTPAPVAARPAPPPRMEMPRPRANVAQAAPMPDPTLSSDMAEHLIESTTQAAVKSTFSRLNGLSTVSSAVTIEDMMREMLRPMLKAWLDENLPSVVERMVEKEISRISRGGN